MHLCVEETAAGVMDRQLALQADALREACGVDRDEFAQGSVRVREFLDNRVASGIVEFVVGIVYAQVRGVDRVICDQTPEVGLDDVPELIVERAGGRLGYGSR